MRQRYCPACGHQLNNADERGVVAFLNPSDNTLHHSCNRIDCMNHMLDKDYIFYGTAKAPTSNTCEGDCA